MQGPRDVSVGRGGRGHSMPKPRGSFEWRGSRLAGSETPWCPLAVIERGPPLLGPGPKLQAESLPRRPEGVVGPVYLLQHAVAQGGGILMMSRGCCRFGPYWGLVMDLLHF